MEGYMKTTEQQHNEKKEELMKKCFECYAENGLTGTGIKALAAACGCTTGNLYCYFKNVDELIIESTAYCMAKVEDEFMESPDRPERCRTVCGGGAVLDGAGARKEIPADVSGIHTSEIHRARQKIL